MGVLLLKCTATGWDFSTGIVIDKDDFADFPDARLTARCPHCQARHAWRTHDARWVDSVVGMSKPSIQLPAAPERKRRTH